MSESPGGRHDAPAAAPGAAVPAVLVMHADLARALVHAAAAVYGDVPTLDVLSNEGLDRAAIEARVGEAVEHWPHGGLVLTDFWGGSCHTCARLATRGKADVIVVTGINLPMLLDYLHNRTTHDVRALAERMLQRGRDSIRSVSGA